MSLVLILGPMKSAKSAELLARTEPFKVAGKKVVYLKPHIDRRNNGVESRLGAQADALTVKSLSEAPRADVYAVDEYHMFPGDSYKTITQWLDNGSNVVISSLDTTYDGSAFPSIIGLMCLKPDEIILKTAVCEVCLDMNSPAKYTQILDTKTNEPLTGGLPEDLTEDGRYNYEARCRKCFVWN